jgi:hypothetical protein
VLIDKLLFTNSQNETAGKKVLNEIETVNKKEPFCRVLLVLAELRNFEECSFQNDIYDAWNYLEKIKYLL